MYLFHCIRYDNVCVERFYTTSEYTERVSHVEVTLLQPSSGTDTDVLKGPKDRAGMGEEDLVHRPGQ